jgi:hypothetical protein
LYTASKDIPHGSRHTGEPRSADADTVGNGGKVSDGAGNAVKKNTSGAIRETVVKPAQKQGTKRKTDDQPETEGKKSTLAPLKKAKTTEEAPLKLTAPVAPRQTPVTPRQTSVAPHQTPVAPRQILIAPRQKPAAPHQKPVAALSKAGSKKRSSATDDEGITTADDPKTPVPPQKKPRINKNDAHKGNTSQPQPIRRSGNVSLILKCQ